MEVDPGEIEALKAKIGPREVLVSVSGGKDSTAACLFLQERGIPYTAVHTDTGWEHTETDTYLREVLPQYIGPITILDAADTIVLTEEQEAAARRVETVLGRRSAMVRATIKKGMFSSRVRRFCTQELKIFPLRDWLNRPENLPRDILNVVGVRAEESKARSELPEWEDFPPQGLRFCQWRPLIAWTEAQVIDIHLRHGVPPNPLYLKGSKRVGCWPCIFAAKAEVRMMAQIDPQRVEALRVLEEEVGKLAKQRAEARGETLESPPAWFVNPSDRVIRGGKRVKSGAPWPIDKVVKWSKTKRGGREDEPFAALPHEQGCTRWGFCDTSWTGAPPVVNKTPDLPIEPERNNTMTMPYVRVVSGTAKAFSGQSFELGPKTLIVGPIGSGKTALVNMIELALGGFASDLAGRGQISSDSMLLEILAAGRTSLEAQVVMSDGSVYRWAKAGRTAAVHEGDLKKAPIFVLRDLVNVVDGSEEKAQRWLLALMGRGLTRSQVLEVLPAPLHTLYATLADQAAGSEVDRLLATREVVRKKEREASSSAKAAKSVVQAVEATVAPQGVPPTEAEMQDAEAKVQSYQAMAEAWASRSAIVEQDGKIVAEYHAAVEVLKQVQALMASAPGKVDTTKLAAVRTVLEVAIDQWKHGATDCALCGSVVKPADMIGRADAMVASIKSTIEASAASVELARKLEAVQKQINHLVLQHNRLVDSMPPEPAVPASLIAATLQSAKTYRDSLHQRRGAAAPVRAASDEAFKHTAAAQEYKLLLDALDEVVERTIKRLVTAFEAKADKYLPEGQLFGLQLSPFRYGYRAGGQFSGVVQPGWSGGQRVQLLCAMAAAVAEINPSLPTVSIPEERSFDPDGLRATLDALAKAPGQIILTSTVMPTNRGGKVPGWTIIDLSGEKKEKEKKPKKEKEAKTEEPLAPLALAPSAPGGSPVPMMVPLGSESLGSES